MTVISLISTWIIYAYGSSVAFTLLTVIYPMYQSILAIESKRTDDDTTWLAYWCIYSFSYVWELTLGQIFSRIIPFYGFFKVLYFVYLMAPMTRGAMTLYLAIL